MNIRLTYYCLLLLLLLPAGHTLAQSLKRQGQKAFINMRYADAIDYLSQYLQKDTTDQEARKSLAESYYRTGQYSRSLPLYKSLAEQVRDSLSLTRYAQLLAMSARYQSAADALDQLAIAGYGDAQTKNRSTLYKSAMQDILQDSARIKVYLQNISSGYADFCPVLHRFGLLFVSDRPLTQPLRKQNGWNGGSFLQVFAINDTSLIAAADEDAKEYAARVQFDHNISRNNDNNPQSSSDSRLIARNRMLNYKAPAHELNLQEVTVYDTRLNSGYHTGPLTFNSRQDTMYLTRSGARNANGISTLELLIYKANHDTWEPIVPFPYNSKNYNTGQAAQIPGTRTIVFTSDMPGGYGGKDLYFSTLSDSGWSKPLNAGALINTAGNEMFPYVTETRTLYFSSDHWPGLGGLDIFFCQLDQDLHPAASPANAGAPLNSPRNDFGVLLLNNGQEGYFSSDRSGNDDIYRFIR